ncbi:hypothetical protein RND71_023535 [Anisodus tanguticus]|uniref:Uncharacterized protein n=1 Tax=Anisodus tanguticus TaxID=243964 RepID=A0AAE1VEU8_9SOLA|nr:hypothetical protein RND71_023535 [Anisodus tanguticus]
MNFWNVIHPEESFCFLCVFEDFNYRGNHLDSSTNNQLNNAVEQLAFIVASLMALEDAHPENEITAQFRAIFIEARDGFLRYVLT